MFIDKNNFSISGSKFSISPLDIKVAEAFWEWLEDYKVSKKGLNGVELGLAEAALKTGFKYIKNVDKKTVCFLSEKNLEIPNCKCFPLDMYGRTNFDFLKPGETKEIEALVKDCKKRRVTETQYCFLKFILNKKPSYNWLVRNPNGKVLLFNKYPIKNENLEERIGFASELKEGITISTCKGEEKINFDFLTNETDPIDISKISIGKIF